MQLPRTAPDLVIDRAGGRIGARSSSRVRPAQRLHARSKTHIAVLCTTPRHRFSARTPSKSVPTCPPFRRQHSITSPHHGSHHSSRQRAPPVQSHGVVREARFEDARKLRSRVPYVNELNKQHGLKSLVEFYEAEGGLPACYLLHPRGHILEIYLQGATITRWLDEMGKNLLYQRPDSVFAPGLSINSGIPLVFPQWREGMLPENGFADKLQWEVVDTDLDFEFVNQLETPNFGPEGNAEMLVDENFESPFEMVEHFDDYMAALDEVEEEEEDEEEEGEDGEGAAAGGAKRRRRKAGTAAAAADGASPADGLGVELPNPPKRRRGRPAKVQPPDAEPGAAPGGHVVGAAVMEPPGPSAAAHDDAEGGPSAGEDEDEGEGEWGERELSPEEREEEEFWESVDWGIIGDLAPCVTLRLADNEETRKMWPHKFELLYKITLMEDDDFPDPQGDLPKGVFDHTGSTADVPFYGPAAGEDGEEGEGEDDDDDDEDELLGDPTKRLRVSGVGTGDVDPEEDVPMQIKMEWLLTNRGDPDEPPMEFQLGARTLFSTLDQANHRNMVQVLGLGGKMMLDYTVTPRTPVLSLCEDDYLEFDGQRHDAVYIATQDATVKFCPGGRTHFELLQRQGVPDTLVYHPSEATPPPGLEEGQAFMAGVGVGRIAVPKRLAPGESYRGEYVIRHHKRYWDAPIWGRQQAQPMPPLDLAEAGGEDDDDLDPALLGDPQRQQTFGLDDE